MPIEKGEIISIEIEALIDISMRQYLGMKNIKIKADNSKPLH